MHHSRIRACSSSCNSSSLDSQRSGCTSAASREHKLTRPIANHAPAFAPYLPHACVVATKCASDLYSDTVRDYRIASERMQRGDIAGAAELFRQLSTNLPGNVEFTVRLAECE
jgi:hypothetical protein